MAWKIYIKHQELLDLNYNFSIMSHYVTLYKKKMNNLLIHLIKTILMKML